MQCFKITIENNNQLEMKYLLNNIYNVVTKNKEVLEYAPNRKIILATGYISDTDVFNIHHNILINKYTTLKDYRLMIKDIIQQRYFDGYLRNVIIRVDILVWNPDVRKDSNKWSNVSTGFKPKNKSI